MTISCIVATFGNGQHRELAKTRAIPSAADQRFLEVIDVHQPDGTLATARNEGARRAKGKWLLFLDADDELEPGFGAAMEAVAVDENMLYTPAVIYARRNIRPQPKIWPRMDFKIGNWCIIGTLISKRVFRKIGGFREYPLYEDWGLFAMAEERCGVGVIEVPEAIYVAHYTRNSRNRAPGPKERLYWHQFIGHDVWPDFYDATTDEEDTVRALRSQSVRHR